MSMLLTSQVIQIVDKFVAEDLGNLLQYFMILLYTVVVSDEERKDHEYDYFYDTIISEDLRERRQWGSGNGWDVDWSRKSECFSYVNQETEEEHCFQIDEEVVLPENIVVVEAYPVEASAPSVQEVFG